MPLHIQIIHGKSKKEMGDNQDYQELMNLAAAAGWV